MRLSSEAHGRLKAATFDAETVARICAQLHGWHALTGAAPVLNLDYDGPDVAPGELVPTITIGLRPSLNATSQHFEGPSQEAANAAGSGTAG